MKVYYNEFNPHKAAMLRALMVDGRISEGVVDERSIRDVQPADLVGYERCHFFAGIGLWDFALNLAGWPEGVAVWTGSCPCQPFSAAGQQRAKQDDRHLWPEWERLISECKPPSIFGEQVSSAIAYGWLDDVYTGLEANGYAVGASIIPACAVGAPHRRERLWFVGNAIHNESSSKAQQRGFRTRCKTRGGQSTIQPTRTSGFCRIAKIDKCTPTTQKTTNTPRVMGNTQNMGYNSTLTRRRKKTLLTCQTGAHVSGGFERPSGFWDVSEWLECPDGKARLIEPSIPLLAHGDTERVAIIHAAGDAIVPQVAAEFIGAFMDAVSS